MILNIFNSPDFLNNGSNLLQNPVFLHSFDHDFRHQILTFLLDVFVDRLRTIDFEVLPLCLFLKVLGPLAVLDVVAAFQGVSKDY
jgi:hypothetical protein